MIHVGKELSISETQAIAKHLLSVFHAYCRQHRLRYFLIGGSLIGAVREGDLVPWDDDIDVAMPRSDYIRLCEEFVDRDNYRLWERTRHGCEHYRCGMAKLADTSTLYFENTADLGVQIGVFLDIFPLDTVDGGYQSSIRFNILLKKVYLFGYLLNSNATKGSLLKEAFRMSARTLCKLIPRSCFIDFLEKRFIAHNKDRAISSYINWWGSWDEKEICPAEAFSSSVQVRLGSFSYDAPAGYHQWLSAVYGDYMTPPSDPRPPHGKVYRIKGDN